jgi:hypothetical protein
LSKDPDGKLHFDVFTNGNIFNMTEGLGTGLDEDMQIIPFFSPASDTQFAIYEALDESLNKEGLPENEGLEEFNQEHGSIRVYELTTVQNSRSNDFKLTLVAKIVSTKLNKFVNGHNIHTMLSTDLNKNLIIFTNTDMQVMDLSSAKWMYLKAAKGQRA